jgi:hypothetical protein
VCTQPRRCAHERCSIEDSTQTKQFIWLGQTSLLFSASALCPDPKYCRGLFCCLLTGARTVQASAHIYHHVLPCCSHTSTQNHSEHSAWYSSPCCSFFDLGRKNTSWQLVMHGLAYPATRADKSNGPSFPLVHGAMNSCNCASSLGLAHALQPTHHAIRTAPCTEYGICSTHTRTRAIVGFTPYADTVPPQH